MIFLHFLSEHRLNRLRWAGDKNPRSENIDIANKFIELLKRFNVFVAVKDLENDLQALLPDVTADFFGSEDGDEVIRQMQKFKAKNMYSFLVSKSTELIRLKDSSLAEPLHKCKELVENYEIEKRTNNRTATSN